MIVNSKLQDVITSPSPKASNDPSNKSQTRSISNQHTPLYWSSFIWGMAPHLCAPHSLHSALTRLFIGFCNVLITPVQYLSSGLFPFSRMPVALFSHSAPFFTSYKAQLKDCPLLKVFALSQSFCPLVLPTFDIVKVFLLPCPHQPWL